MTTSTRVTAPAPGRAARRARIATTTVFLVHGALFASWTPRIPAVRDALHAGNAELGLALLGSPAGALGAMLMAGALIARLGSTVVVRGALLGYCLVAVLVGLAQTVPELFGALFCWGVFHGSLDVSMNSQAGSVERLYRRSIFAGFHAWWSLGAFAGTGLGVVLIAADVPLTWHLLGAGVVLAAAILPLTRWMLPADADPAADGTHGIARPTLQLLGLGLIAMLGMFCEGAASDWSAVYLRDDLGMTASSAGIGYAAFALAMFVGRSIGDRVITALGSRTAIRISALTAGLSLGFALLIGDPVAGIIGFALLGLGLGLVVPCLFSVSSRLPGTPSAPGLAFVTVFGWAGFLCGPPLIGFLSNTAGLPAALGVAAAGGLLMAILAGAVPRSAGPVGSTAEGPGEPPA